MNVRSRKRLDSVLGIVGRTLITAGLLLLGLVVYQLWGTGLEQQRAQSRLRDEFSELISTTPTTATPTASTEPTAERVDSPRRPNSALALLEIPSASVADIVVNSASVSALRHGPGHIEGTALPGEQGNSAIAGHRTTYGAPFAKLDKVSIGDEIRVTTVKGRFNYTVSDVLIVAPNRTDLLRPQDGRTLLTLVTCHPRWSTAKRLIVVADLVSTEPIAEPVPTSTVPVTTVPAPTAPEDDAVESIELDGWFSDTGAIVPALLLGLALVAIAFATHFGRRELMRRGHRRRNARVASWAIAAVPFVVVLFYWYHFINMLLPAST
jgi:sortase A